MKKTIAVILTIAVLGLLGVANKSSSSQHQLTSPANTSAANAMSPSSGSATTGQATAATYKDGTFNGASEATPYGTVQIAVVISGGKIVDVNFLQMPSDQGHSQEVTSFAKPLLKQTTLSAQSANIDFVSGATTSSEAYQMSLQAALDQAQA